MTGLGGAALLRHLRRHGLRIHHASAHAHSRVPEPWTAESDHLASWIAGSARSEEVPRSLQAQRACCHDPSPCRRPLRAQGPVWPGCCSRVSLPSFGRIAKQCLHVPSSSLGTCGVQTSLGEALESFIMRVLHDWSQLAHGRFGSSCTCSQRCALTSSARPFFPPRSAL